MAHYPLEYIAEKLDISVYTVRTYVSNMLNDFYTCTNRHECQIQALKKGVITLDDIVMDS